MIAIHIQNNITLDKKLLRIKRINAGRLRPTKKQAPKIFHNEKRAWFFQPFETRIHFDTQWSIWHSVLLSRETMDHPSTTALGSLTFGRYHVCFYFYPNPRNSDLQHSSGTGASDAGIKQGLEELSADLRHDQYSEAVADEQCSPPA